MALRRSLVAANDLAAGTLFDSDCVIAMRPGTGLAPDYISNLSGRRLT
jgi:sialic acid synthase SpsE